MTPDRDPRPLIAHVVYRFDVGGLENGVVNLINRLPRDAYRHAVVSLTDVTDFRRRVVAQRRRSSSRCTSRPATPSGSIRGCMRCSGECARRSCTRATSPRSKPWCRHGRPACRCASTASTDATWSTWTGQPQVSVDTPLYRPFVTHYVAVSRDLERYLCANVGVPPERVAQIYNGVDAVRFRPAEAGRGVIDGCPFRDPDLWLVGTVGRMDPVKDQLNLVRAFVQALQLAPAKRARMRLVIVGDGALRARRAHPRPRPASPSSRGSPASATMCRRSCAASTASCCRRSAKASPTRSSKRWRRALPVIATGVGGNAELVEAGSTGELVPAADPHALAQAMLAYARDPEAREGRGAQRACAGRARIQPRGDGRPLSRTLRSAARAPPSTARSGSAKRCDGNEAMCGITGIFDSRGRREIGRDVLARMNESQHHRGPDEEGLHLEPGVGLGHRRLSIIDLATGQQPLYNEDGSVVRRLQRRDLQLPGADPRARRARPRVPHAAATPKSSCTRGKRGASAASSASAACSRSRCGTATARRCSSRATGSASSRCTTRCCPTACCSSARS